jgi:FkbM family methyltransferase
MSSKFRELWRKFRWWTIYQGPRRDVTIPTWNGLLTVDSKDWLIGKYLYVRRQYEAHEIKNALRLLRKGGYLGSAGRGTVLDVGANIGMISIALVKNGEFERAVAFEPAPTSYRLLVHNIHQNRLRDRIQSFPIALSSGDGEMELEFSDDNSGDNRLRATTASGRFGEEKRRTLNVPARTLDGLFSDDVGLHDEDVAMVWLDVQGHEGQFLEGARRVLGRGVPVVSEFWPYAILRSGMSQAEFCATVSNIFTHFYVVSDRQSERCSVSQLEGLFVTYSQPRQMCLVALVR